MSFFGNLLNPGKLLSLGGGGSNTEIRTSDSSTQTQTTNNQFDNRQVYDASGGGVLNTGLGSVNQYDYSDKSILYDNSNRSSTSINYDNSNRSTNYDQSDKSIHYDNSNRSVNTYIDGGALKEATEQSRIAAGLAALVMKDATAGARAATEAAQNRANQTQIAALGLARSNQAAAFDSMKEALGAVAEAYDGAKGDADAGNKLAAYAIFAAAAVAVAFVAFRK